MFVNREYKQVIVIRQDLKMSTGKKVAQGCHAAVNAVMHAKVHAKSEFKKWYNEGQKKVALKVNSQEQLESIFSKAEEMNLPRAIIKDAGLTQLEPGTMTAVAIGPAKSSEIDKITGDIKLL